MGKVLQPYYRIQDGKLYIQGDFYQSSVNGVSNNGRYEIRLNGILMDTVPVAKNYAEQYFDTVKNLPSNATLLLNAVDIDIEDVNELYYFCFMENAYYASDIGNPIYPDKLAVAIRDDVGSITLSQNLSSVGNYDKNGINIVYRNNIRQGSSYKLNVYSTAGVNTALSQFVICPNVIVDLRKYTAGTITITPVTDHEHPEFEYTSVSFSYDDQELDITLYRNSSESIRIDKTNQLVFVDRLRGKFRSATDISNPVIEISRANGNTIGMFNYVYIAKFKRYYYVTDITSVRSNLWSISLSTDVLMSFKDKILEQQGFILRNEFNYRDEVVDELRSSLPQPRVVDLYFKGFKSAYELSGVVSLENFYNSVIMVNFAKENYPDNREYLDGIGGETYSLYPNMEGNGDIFCLNGNNSVELFFHSVVKINEEYFNIAKATTWTGVLYGQEPEEFIIKWLVLPVDIREFFNDTSSFAEKVESVTLGTVNTQTMIEFEGLYHVNTRGHNLQKVFKLTIPKYGEFDYLKYTSKISVYIPFYGWVDLPPEYFIGYDMYVQYILDLMTGDVDIHIYTSCFRRTGNEGGLYSSYKTNFAVDLPLARTNNNEITRNAIFTAIDIGIKSTSSALNSQQALDFISGEGRLSSVVGGYFNGIGKTLLTEKPATDETPATYGIGNIKNILDSFKPKQSAGLNGQGANNVKSARDFYVRIIYDDTIRYNEYDHLYGRPAYYHSKFNTLKGYTVVGNVHLEGFDTAMSKEVSQIEQLLLNGVIF